MKSSYKIYWTNHALNELKEVFNYLEINWTEKELRKLSIEIEKPLKLISINPKIFPKTKKNIRRVVITKHNTLYYRKKNKTIEIISYFSNSKSPNKLKL